MLKVIGEVFEKVGFEVIYGVGKIGLVVILWCGFDEMVIGFCVDMDVLLIIEVINFFYCLSVEGKFYGCGYDGYSMMFLGVVLELVQDFVFNCVVYFIFQLDEENGNGVIVMIVDGLFDCFFLVEIYGFYNMSGMVFGYFVM